MPKISFDEAINKINSGSIKPIYFLAGKEKFFHDQFIETLIQNIFTDKASKDLNLTILYGSENSLGELISAVIDYPMLSNQKLVVVRDFDKMKIVDSEALSKYLSNPQKTTCLVLSSEEKGKTKIFKTIQEVAQTIECKPIPEYKVGEWINKRCKHKSYTIEPQAIQFLINHLGSSLLNIDQELNKIINYKNDNTIITVYDLEQTTGVSREINVFALQKALSHRQLANSLRISKRLLESGENINAINAVLFSYFKKMLIAASLKRRGNNRKQISEQMKLSDFQLKDILESINNFSIQQIKSIITLLHQMDIGVKTSTISEGSGLQMLCYKICSI